MSTVPRGMAAFQRPVDYKSTASCPNKLHSSNEFSPRMGDSVNWDWQAQWGYDHSHIKMMHTDWAEKTPTL